MSLLIAKFSKKCHNYGRIGFTFLKKRTKKT